MSPHTAPTLPVTLSVTGRLDQLEPANGPDLLPGGRWHLATRTGQGLVYRFAPGSLTGMACLWCDLLLEGTQLAVFQLQLQEGETGPVFEYKFGLLNHAVARLRVMADTLNQNTLFPPREGALLKPMVTGSRVDLARVDRARIVLIRMGTEPVRWCMTDPIAAAAAPQCLDQPALPRGPLVDETGQATFRHWTGKCPDAASATALITQQFQHAESQRWPDHFDRWGGSASLNFGGNGFFRTHHDGRRWWMVDPDGGAFWSAGVDCVRANVASNIHGLKHALAWLPEPTGPYAQAFEPPRPSCHLFNHLAANFIRAFGPEDWRSRWNAITLSQLRAMGFNTIANWSDWEMASAARFPYVRPLNAKLARTPKVFRDFPDVFHPDFAVDAAEFAQQLLSTRDDPALIGYFLMNEPAWGFASETPAVGMLHNTPTCRTREALADSLRERYGSSEALAKAWGVPVTLEQVAQGPWTSALPAAALADLARFSGVMALRFFGGLSDACKAVDPNHLNLGARYHIVPPDWAVEAMKSFDVFSVNGYRKKVASDDLGPISRKLGRPVMVGEFHFGALDGGLPGSGIGHVPDQASRGQAYRVYVEDAASRDWCVGVHYFQWYDQPALGRFDGENYNIGVLDVCNQPYRAMTDAARATHERLYELAQGKMAPFADEPVHLPLLF